MPDGQVLLERIDEVMENIRWNIQVEKRCSQRRLMFAGAHVKYIGFDRVRQIACQRVLVLNVLIHVGVIHSAAHLALRVMHKIADRALGQVQYLAITILHRLEFKIGIGEHAGRIARTLQRVGDQT